MTPITWEGEGVILIMYNLISLNWHVSDSQNNYTSKKGFRCSHGFMSLMLIQTVKLKLESDMSLETCDILITYKEFDNNRCLAV